MENETKNKIRGSASDSKDEPQSSSCPLFLGNTTIGGKILQFLEGIPYSIFISLITIVTLLSDDIRCIFFQQDSDVPFSILTLVCMCFYIIEMVLLCLVKYYFWLDLISTLSMLLDLTWIRALITGDGISATSKVVKLAKVSRVSKIGAQSTKLIRIIRLIRVLRLYKTARNQINKENQKKIIISEQIEMRKTSLAIVGQANNNRIEKLRSGTAIVMTKHDMKHQTNRSFTMEKQKTLQKQNSQQQTGSKHEVSLKNIVFEGSQRKLSVLHPSQKVGSNRIIGQPQKIVEFDMRKKEHKVSIEPQKADKTDGNLAGVGDHPASIKDIQNHLSSQQILLHQETRVGSRLKQEIQKNVVSMILLILISIPLFRADTWFDNNVTSYDSGIYTLTYFATYNLTQFNIALPSYISDMTKISDPLVFLSIDINSTCCEFPRDFTSTYKNTKSIDQIRDADILVSVSKFGTADKNITVAFDQTADSILEAQLSIGRTLFVCILLIVVTILFTRDVEIQALEPLENMIDTVKKISSNPLQAIKDIEKENMIKKVIETKKGGTQPKKQSEEELVMMAKQEKKNQTEPAILENMIIKIGSLLAVGFGEAGTELIAKNIQNNGSLNVMIPGKKVMCIFGFCDIRNFTDATEVLEAGVMVFVNEIAEICHEVVNRVGGNPNKNIGDAFLLVWKFDEDDTVSVQNKNNQTDLQMRSSLKVKQTADLAVYSFVKMIAEIAKANNLQKYKENEGLKKRIKNYEGVKMGFGLHIGWAIEGPIGSEFKIDASYLGSHVNFSGRLEAATKQYGIPMLISQQIYNLMTLKNRQYLRQVDHVKLSDKKNEEEPGKAETSDCIGLYTVDISLASLIKNIGVSPQNRLTVFEKKKAKVFHNQQRDKLIELIEKKRVTGAIWNEDKDIKAMREPFSRFFYEEWKKGFEFYQKGKWKQAEEIFKKTLVMGLNHDDGPSKALLEFMSRTNFECPQDWDGARQFEG